MQRIAVFPGSFDPFTLGHKDIVNRALPMFDQIIIAIGSNSSKNCMFTQEQRIEWIKDVFKDEPKITVEIFEGLTVNFCKDHHSHFIIRGLRSYTDFDYEFAIAQMNKKVAPEIETVFLLTDPEFSAVSSSIVRDLIRNKGNVDQFLPKEIKL